MKNNHHSPRRLTALLLVVAVMLSLIPSAFAAQQNSYHDPAEHWQEALNRTNELDANSVVTVETFDCCVCDKATAFEVFRVPEYTRNGETALTRNVKYSDGTCLDGKSKGDLLDGTPGVDSLLYRLSLDESRLRGLRHHQQQHGRYQLCLQQECVLAL